MTLLEIRTKFVEISGRYDLVVNAPSSYTDKGADFYIRAGQKYLDGLTEFDKSSVEVSTTLSVGNMNVGVAGFRAIGRVRLVQTDGSSYYLTPLVVDEYRELGDRMPQNGMPNWFSVIPSLRYVSSAEGISGQYITKSIALYPPPDRAYKVIFEGLKWSDELLVDGDVSFWSIAHPDILVQAALYKMEQFYRNTAGAGDYQRGIIESVTLLNHDYIQEGVNPIVAMRDSW